MPAQIHTRLPVGVRFPISGYSTAVDWDASALADFQYLSLILVHELAPEEAVRQAHLLAPFTGVHPVGGTDIEPLGLGIRPVD